MRKNYVTMLCLAMMRVACGQQTKQKETTMEFTDQVKEALADGGRRWIRGRFSDPSRN